MNFRIIIPARYASTRLPGKALLDIAGKPMIQHVYERACNAGAISVVIATDDARIAHAAKTFQAPVCMTSAAHRTGTDRLAEVIALMGYDNEDIIVNVQGDEPLVPPEIITQVAHNLVLNQEASVATLCARIHDIAQLVNPNVVKLVMDAKGYALYFSRSPIPWLKDEEMNLPQQAFYAHIGLYAYRAGFIQRYINWPHCALEVMESLEQLRVLWNGEKIHVDVAVKSPPQDVNTQEDLIKVRTLLSVDS